MRFPELSPKSMTPAQREAAEAIRSGPRGGLAGPFNTWLRSPDLADRLQRVGEYVRFRSSLPQRLNELAILVTAIHWQAAFEWYAHYQLAEAAGLDKEILAALAAGRRPARMTEEERVIHDFARELHETRQVSDATFEAALRAFGEQGVVDLIGACGYYAVVSMTLNVAQVPVPPGSTIPPLPPRA